MAAQRTHDGRPLSHWSVAGHDENGDIDGEVCRCEISDNHFTDGRPWPDDRPPAKSEAGYVWTERSPEERERGRWLAWLVEIGYGVDFVCAPPPPCTPSDLAEYHSRIDGESVEDWTRVLLDGNSAGGWYGPKPGENCGAACDEMHRFEADCRLR